MTNLLKQFLTIFRVISVLGVLIFFFDEICELYKKDDLFPN